MSARRNSSVTSKYLSVCAERKRPWPEIPELRKLPNISDFTVSNVDEDATISVSEFRGGSWRKSGHGLPIQFGYIDFGPSNEEINVRYGTVGNILHYSPANV